MNVMQKFIYVGAVALLLVSTTPETLQAQGEKVGLVNFKTCVEKSKYGKQEQENFEILKKQMEQVLQEKEKTLNEISSKFEDPDYVDSLSTEAEAELKHKFRTLNQEFSQHQQQYYQVLNQANYKIVQKLTETVNKASATVAAGKGIDMVLNEEGTFYYSPALDISDDVVIVMDKLYDEQEKK